MMAKKSIAQISILLILLIVVSVWFIISKTGKTDGDVYDMLPADAALIIEVDNPGELLAKDKNSIYQKLKQVDVVDGLFGDIQFLDSLLLDYTDYKELLWNSSVTIAIYSDTNNVTQFLILSEIGTNPNTESIKQILEKKLGRNYGLLDTQGFKNGFKIVDAGTNVTQYLAFQDGVLIYTTSSRVFLNSYDTYNETLPRLSDDKQFNVLAASSSSKAQARAYIQYSKIVDLISHNITTDMRSNWNWLESFASWTEVDIMLKNKELLLSGFTISDSLDYFSRSFKEQNPVQLKAINVLPYNTNTLIWTGVSDFRLYFDDTYNDSRIAYLSTRLNYDINNFIDVIGDEIAFASNALTSSAFDGSSWFVAKINNHERGISVLKRIAGNKGKSRVSTYNGYSIGRIDQPDFLSKIFGNAVGGAITKNYFTFIGGYAVFANSVSSLENLISYFETGKTLDLNDNFKSFSDNIASNSNMLVYINPGDIINRLRQYFNPVTSRELEFNDKVISSFQGLSFQLSKGEELAFTSIYTNNAEDYHEENLSLWKVKLEDEITCGPFLVSDHQTKSKNVIVFDNLNNMYLIDSDGKELWNRKIDGKPIAQIFEVDYYKNRKYQYLFNTADYIYLIDKKGRDVTGYPKKLHSKATNGIVVFDYLNNKDYRLLLAQSDKKVYNYNIKGKEISGWNEPKMQNIVIDPVKRLLVNKKDYIIVTDIENEIKIVNRKGNRRIKVSQKLKKARNSDYYVNRTNSKGIIITTDESGKLVYISSSGKLKYTDFGKFSPDHFFLYEDFNGDRSKDFIYIDGNKLSVFDRFKKVLFSYDFGSVITIPPTFFSLGGKQHVLGVVANQERTIYLFDKKGNIIISKGLVGETQFTVGDIQNSNKINLVSAAGNTLYNYRLK